ncbi:hypothetical protein FA13DRAFT_1732256 [Coprinellus micaceus]|uniref:Uncharacterized protein n=1 Tax=Coprinellus micaceus TaxID=71717 RepID=A0A4Y7TCS5_COPMI|nr:hypothetical protein FA13DRAFT_1732256 [Coprinellus micaceus]
MSLAFTLFLRYLCIWLELHLACAPPLYCLRLILSIFTSSLFGCGQEYEFRRGTTSVRVVARDAHLSAHPCVPLRLARARVGSAC